MTSSRPKREPRETRRSHIPRDCREEFVPVNLPGAALREKWGIRLAGLSDLTRGYHMNRRNCSFIILICVLGGEGICRQEKEDIILKEGSVYAVDAGWDQLYWTDGKWSILWFHLEKDFWKGLPSPILIDSCPDEITSLKSVMDTYLRESRIPSNVEILSSLGNLAAPMISRLLRQTGTGSANSREATRDKFVTDRLLRQINRSIGRAWTVAELADLAGVTSSYLYKITARALGKTPLGMVRDTKMDVARQLLLHSDYPLKFIAERVGYSTAYAFSKAFKKEFGESPGKYRIS